MKEKRTFPLIVLIVLLIIFSTGVLYKNSLEDEISPIITLFDREVVESTCPGELASPYLYTAFDNVDGDITNKVVVTYENGEYIWKVSDAAGNISEERRKVKRIDNEKPEITLNGKNIIYVKQNTLYEDKGVNVSDNCSIDLNYTVNGIVDTSKLGRYNLTYIAVDTVGNRSEISRQVIVYEDENIPDNSGYTVIKEGPTYIKDILIVNKEYSIPNGYKVDDSLAKEALNELKNTASNEGYSLPLISAYRSYLTQANIYNNYVLLYGKEIADTISARPGHSEHQTGLSFDLGSLNQEFGETKEGKWLKENCHKYGFIIRYPKGKEYITGYSYEPWHIRYVGVEVATEIMQNNLTLEEYLDLA